MGHDNSADSTAVSSNDRNRLRLDDSTDSTTDSCRTTCRSGCDTGNDNSADSTADGITMITI